MARKSWKHTRSCLMPRPDIRNRWNWPNNLCSKLTKENGSCVVHVWRTALFFGIIIQIDRFDEIHERGKGADPMLESVWERLRAFGCKQTEHILYWISIWCVLGVGLVYIAAFYIAHVTGNDQLLQCKMKLYFGIPCPGCGGTRAIWSLLHGRVLQAVYYNCLLYTSPSPRD